MKTIPQRFGGAVSNLDGDLFVLLLTEKAMGVNAIPVVSVVSPDFRRWIVWLDSVCIFAWPSHG